MHRLPALFRSLPWCILVFARPIGILHPPQAAAQQESPIAIQIIDASGHPVAVSSATAANSRATHLDFERRYLPGDRLVVTAPAQFALQLGSQQQECWIHRTQPGPWSYTIPVRSDNRSSKEMNLPDWAEQSAHHISVRTLSPHELKRFRNLALNPCDQDAPSTPPTFPHASANNNYHNMSVFMARNAIDGMKLNTHHGRWPYQSWGPDKQSDLWWQVEFGREVEIR